MEATRSVHGTPQSRHLRSSGGEVAGAGGTVRAERAMGKPPWAARGGSGEVRMGGHGAGLAAASLRCRLAISRAPSWGGTVTVQPHEQRATVAPSYT